MTAHFAKNRLSLALSAAVLAVGTQSAPVIAQDESLALEEVVVTARKRSESLQDVPLTINALDRELLDRAGIEDIEGVAAFTPGFDFAQSFGRQDFRPAIRGQSTILGGANAGLFIDGFFVGEGAATLPLTAIERVEVVKGPQGALYGRSTLAGAVNYVLKRPTDSFEGEAKLTAGEDGELRGDLTLRGPIGDTAGYMVSISHYEYDGQYQNGFQGNDIGAPANSDDVGGEETDAIAAVFTWEPNERFDSQLNILWEESEDDPYGIVLLDSDNNNCAFGPAPNPPAGTPGDGTTGSAYNNSGYFCGEVDPSDILDSNGGRTNLELGFYDDMSQQFEALRLGLTLGWDFEAHRLQSKTSVHDYETEVRQDQGFGGSDYWVNSVPFPPFAFRNRFGFLSDNRSEADEWSQEFTFSNTGEGDISYLIGAYYYEYSREGQTRNSSNSGLAATDPGLDLFPLVDVADRDETNWAVYGQLLWQFADNWNVGFELRYSEDKIEASGGDEDLDLSETYDSVLPRFTLNWDVSDNVMLYGVVSQGNKPGDFNTDFGLRDDQRPVDEEEAWNYELGVKSTLWDGRAILNVAAYYIDWEDQQLTTTTVTSTGGNTSILDNLGETEITGIELEFSASLTSWWDMYLGYAYTDSEIKEYIISAEDNLTPNGMLSIYEEAAQFGFPYLPNGDVNISGTELPQVSKNQATFSNTFYGDFGGSGWGWYGRIDYLYNSKRYAQVYNAADTGDMERLNLRVGVANDNWTIEGWVRNATDDETSPALIRYVQVKDGNFVFGPDRAIGATLAEKRTAGITVGLRF